MSETRRTRAIVQSRRGDAETLVWAEHPLPAPSAGDVVIRVAAAGINNSDILQREGFYPVPDGASPVLGIEVSGVLTWVGHDVTGWSVGDQVCALLSGGGYAEEVVVSAQLLLPVPSSVTLVEAASLPEAACTVYSNLRNVASVSSGQAVLIHGGSGGIGTFAVQWARAIGTRVFTTVGNSAKAERVAQLGADVVIQYRQEDFAARVLHETHGRGVDAILDVVGPDYLERNLAVLAEDGHLVVIGFQSATAGRPLDFGLLMSKRGSVSATRLRGRPLAQRAAIVESVRREVWPLVEAGAIRPVVDRVLPLRDASVAHRIFESGAYVGKIVLQAD